MELEKVHAIRLAHFPSRPINPPMIFDEGPLAGVQFGSETPVHPETISARVEVSVKDSMTASGAQSHELEFFTRFSGTARDAIGDLETRALRQLASDLRFLAEAFDREVERRAEGQ